MKKRIGWTVLLALALGLPALPYIEVLYPLQQFMAESEAIALGEIEKVDEARKAFIIKVKRSLKGKCAYERFRINLGMSRDWAPEVILKHAVVGAPVVVFYNAEKRGQVYLNRFFMQLIGEDAEPDKAWWTFNHVEIRCNRTFNGTAEELAKTVTGILSGKTKPPPPDAKLPAITKADVLALPPHGQPVEESALPRPFRKRVPAASIPARDPDAAPGAVKGLAVEVFQASGKEPPAFEKATPARKSAADEFGLAEKALPLALRFTGFVEVPKAGVYTFTTLSRGVSTLSIGGNEVVYNVSAAGAAEGSGEVHLKPGKHAVQATYFIAEGEPAFEVHWEGPDLPRQKIPAAALSRAP